MERYEIGDDASLSSLVDAARRGEEAVLTINGAAVASVEPTATTELRTRDGKAPAHGIDREALARLHATLPPGLRGGGAALIRELRDMGY